MPGKKLHLTKIIAQGELYLLMMKVQKRPLRVLFVGSEMWPYASAGGLSRVISYLPQALNRQGVDARVMIPKYGKIDTKKYKFKKIVDQLKVPTGKNDKNSVLICNVLSNQQPNEPMTYFLENREYYELRANVYEYADDHVRWGLLQKGVWEFVKTYDEWVPDVIHCHDWHTGLVANFFHQSYQKFEKLEHIKTVFTIHNLGYQAPFDHRFVSELDSDSGQSELPDILAPELAKLNSVRRGILYSDLITTVSPTYAKEILTPEYGEGLDGLLKEVKAKLVGILNGLDYNDYNPLTDINIQQNYKKGEWVSRLQNKLFLQDRFSLNKDLDVPLFGISYRLTSQKGLDLVMEVMETVINEFNAQFVINGDGDVDYKTFFLEISKKYPQNVGINLNYDEFLPRQIFAGTDFLLHPSKFEPCGIVQMEAMAYGCIPIVRVVGGLADTVVDEENGFTFKEFKSSSLLLTMARATEIYKHKEIIYKIRSACMSQDFSWKVAAEKYLRNYKTLVGIK
jgi:starch synthase